MTGQLCQPWNRSSQGAFGLCPSRDGGGHAINQVVRASYVAQSTGGRSKLGARLGLQAVSCVISMRCLLVGVRIRTEYYLLRGKCVAVFPVEGRWKGRAPSIRGCTVRKRDDDVQSWPLGRMSRCGT